jgi:hypothetical protein
MKWFRPDDRDLCIFPDARFATRITAPASSLVAHDHAISSTLRCPEGDNDKHRGEVTIISLLTLA